MPKQGPWGHDYPATGYNGFRRTTQSSLPRSTWKGGQTTRGEALRMSEARKRNSPKPLTVRRLPVAFTSDIRRVITRYFDPGGEARIQNVVQRVAQLSDTEATRLLELVFQRFRTRHSNIALVFEQHYHNAMSMIGASDNVARNRRLLIGSYF